ncbi:MAG: tetratricopeptide repeat protein [Phycisphaerae bacterium]
MTHEGDTTASAAMPIIDVWSRTTPRYRRRAVFMLSLLALLFAGLCCFTFWLRTGVYAPWSHDGYVTLMRHSFNPVGAEQVTLTDFLTYPISVQRVRAHGITMGLLFASLCSIPILVAILYRFPCSIIFASMVVFLAAMPWLGITVLGGCAVTAIRPFKLSFRYASALLGLVPVALYFVMASWEPAGSQPSSVGNQALLYAPWFLALLGSCIICATALGVARLIGYRPGGIPPILAVLFALPVLIFYRQVGRDALEYHILEHEIGPNGKMFRPVDIDAEARVEATHRWWNKSRHASYDTIHRVCLDEAIRRVATRLEEDRTEAVRRCDSFMDRFGASRYVPSVLYLKGRAIDQRLRQTRLEFDHRAEYDAGLPSPRSRDTWETIVEKFSGAGPVTTVAMCRLAVLHARDGALDRSIALLRRLRSEGEADDGVAERDTSADAAAGIAPASMFGKAPASSGLGIDTSIILLQARRLEEMLAACRGDPRRPLRNLLGERRGDPNLRVHPVQLLLWLDPEDPHYHANLAAITHAFPQSTTAGYIENRLANLIPSVFQRITRFRTIVAKLDGHAAGAEALFYLAEALDEDSIVDKAKATLDELVRKYPDSCWADEARERLSSLTMLASGAD